MSESDQDTITINKEMIIKLAENLPALLPLFKELDFIIEIDIEGESKKEGFEPTIKAKIKIARNITDVIKVKEAESRLKTNDMFVMKEAMKYTPQSQTVTTSTTDSNNNFTWTDTDKKS